MTDQQPEALRLADWLEHRSPLHHEIGSAAAELRRLHSVNELLMSSYCGLMDAHEQEMSRLHDINAQLLEALERMVNDDEHWDAMANARTTPSQQPEHPTKHLGNTMQNQDIIKMLEAEWKDRLKAAVEAEREACAKVCEEISPEHMDVPYGDIRWGWKHRCPYAAAIRNRQSL